MLLVSYDLMLPHADKSTVGNRVGEFVAERKWNLPVVIFDPVDLDKLNERFNLSGPIPVTIAFDKFGHIADREDGPADKARFEELVKHAR